MQQYYPYQQPYYGYSAPRPQARNTQPLTAEQIAKLRQGSNAFDLKIEQEDLWRAMCTHKEKNGVSTLVHNADDTWTCTICGETFSMSDASDKDVANAVKILIDMLQTSKAVYLDASEQMVAQYYQIIPLLQKFPVLWKKAIENFAKYDGTTATPNPIGMGYSGFGAIGNLLANPYGGYMPPQQPNVAPTAVPGAFPMPVGYPMAQQPAPQAPQYQPTAPAYYPNPADPNPLAYGYPAAPAPVGAPAPAPAVPAAPVAPAPGVIPAAPQAAAPAQSGEVVQQQTFNV